MTGLKAFCSLPIKIAIGLQIDGESIQIICLKENALLTFLRDVNIDVTKSFHSGTATTQPCNAGNMFKGSKKVNKHLSKVGRYYQRGFVEAHSAVFKLHNAMQ